MKKILHVLCGLLCSLSFLSSCDKKPELPPTVEDIIAEYSGENLKATIEGASVDPTKVKVKLAQSTDSKTISILLYNVVPGVTEFRVSNAEFTAATKSSYVSVLKGESTDNMAGYQVKVDGTVDNKVLTVKITLKEIEAFNILTQPLIGLVYKGNMTVSASDTPEPVVAEQRVYLTKNSLSNPADTSMVKLTIKNFNLPELGVKTIAVDTILIQKRGEVLAFKAIDRKIRISSTVILTLHLRGTIVGEKMNLNLDIEMSGRTIHATLEGQTVVEGQTAEMKSITVEGEAVAEQIRATDNLNRLTDLTLYLLSDTPDAPILLTPLYELSEGAQVDSAEIYINGVTSNRKLTADQIAGKQPVDFSLLTRQMNSYIKYFLSSEDPNAAKASILIHANRVETTALYDMQTWVTDPINNLPTPKGLTNSNSFNVFLSPFGIRVPTGVERATDGSAEIRTSRTVSETIPNTLIPGVTAGILFTGMYILNVESLLKSPQYGVPYRNKPDRLTATYKYAKGVTYYKTIQIKQPDGSVAHGTEVVPNMPDTCEIGAYLYEVNSYKETLDNTNIRTSKKVILKAVLSGLATNNSYKTETILFEKTGNGVFDPTKKYKLAVVCKSSKREDEFMGADGSRLWIKHLEIQ